jgi:hypothetical protein
MPLGEQQFLHRCLSSSRWLHLASENCVNYNPFVSNTKWFLKTKIFHVSVLLGSYSNWINRFLRILLTHTFTTGISCTARIWVEHQRAPNSVHSCEALHFSLFSTVNKWLLLYNTSYNCKLQCTNCTPICAEEVKEKLKPHGRIGTVKRWCPISLELIPFPS